MRGRRYPADRTEKPCSGCGVIRPLDEFAPGNNSDGRQSRCRECANDARKAQKGTPSGVQRNELAKARRRAHGRLNAEALVRYLLTHPCVDCGEADPVVLDFDHVYGTKVMNVSSMVRGSSWARIMTEIDKCEVRCANCHRRKTAVQLGWYSYFGRDHAAEAAESIHAIRSQFRGPMPPSLFDPETETR